MSAVSSPSRFYPHANGVSGRALSGLPRPVRVVRRMHGASQAVLIECSDATRWVVKLTCSSRCENILFNEFVGDRMCRSVGLPMPEIRFLWIPEEFIRGNDLAVLHAGARVPADAGLHFGSAYLMDVLPHALYEFLPGHLESRITNRHACLGMFLFDLWSMHSDVRQAIYALDGDGYSATFFDNSHLFGGPHWSLANPAQPAGTIERAGLGALHRSDWTAEWIWRFRKMLPQALREAVRQTPAHWHGGDVEALQLRLRARLAAMESIVEETALRTSLGAV